MAGDRVAIYMPMIPELPIAMLACARLGAAHTVIFGGFSAEALSDRINDAEAKVLITADGGWRRGKPVGLKHHADEALVSTPSITGTIVVSRLGEGIHMVEGRDHWWHEIVDRQDPICPPVPVDSEQLLYLLYTSGTTAKPKGIIHTSAGYLLGRFLHPRDRLRRQARRRLLVRRRHRLGDRPQLHRLRAAGQCHDRGHVRRRPGHARLGSLVADRRGPQGHDPVLRADGDPRVHEAGRGLPGPPRPVVAAGPRLGRRADQPRGLAVVPAQHRRRPEPDRRHLVADRDRLDPDQPAARGHDHQARLGDLPVARDRGRRGRCRRPERAVRWRRLPRPEAALAVDAARDLRRPGPLSLDLLEPLPGDVLRRRRRQARRGGLLLAARPGR